MQCLDISSWFGLRPQEDNNETKVFFLHLSFRIFFAKEIWFSMQSVVIQFSEADFVQPDLSVAKGRQEVQFCSDFPAMNINNITRLSRHQQRH